MVSMIIQTLLSRLKEINFLENFFIGGKLKVKQRNWWSKEITTCLLCFRQIKIIESKLKQQPI